MNFLRNIFGGGASGRSSSGREYWVYVRCRRCGEPLRSRIDLHNDLSLNEEGDAYVVRKGLVGGERRCYQTCEVTLTFDLQRSKLLSREVTDGEFISADEYEQLRQNPPIEDTGEVESSDEQEQKPDHD